MNDERPQMTNHRPRVADDHTSVVAGRRPVVELEIGELVLHGFAPDDRGRIGAAVERELARLLSEQALPPSWSRHSGADRLDAGSFDLAPDMRAEAIGAHIARALYTAIGGEIER